MKTGTLELAGASKALSGTFDGCGIDNMRERIAARKKKVAEEASDGKYELEREGLETHEESEHQCQRKDAT